VANAAARLRKRGHLDWEYLRLPNESRDPLPEEIDQRNFERTRDISVSGAGLQALAGVEAKTATTINIINSTVGQLALGDIGNIDLFVILEAAERSLDQLDAPADVKAEARTVLQRMRAAGASVASATVTEVLAAAVRKAIGLP
jgi:hypothetical protein